MLLDWLLYVYLSQLVRVGFFFVLSFKTRKAQKHKVL